MVVEKRLEISEFKSKLKSNIKMSGYKIGLIILFSRQYIVQSASVLCDVCKKQQ